MTHRVGGRLDRREFLIRSFYLGGGVLIGLRSDPGAEKFRVPALRKLTSLEGGAFIGTSDFLQEGNPPMNILLGVGLGGRRFADLSLIPLNGISDDPFFVRTRAPLSHARHFPWKISIGGEVENPFTLTLSEIEHLSVPQGTFVLECAGNDPGGRFGMLSAASWEGISFKEILARIKQRTAISPRASRVLISGLDDHPPDGFSVPGADWIFTFDQLASSNAFLATGMNGRPLPADNGHPVRLLVPGWYGCTCIKWVNGISFLTENAPATAHMKEYAGRTRQEGIPERAKDYRPAAVGLAAMPVRLEKWKVEGRILYRLVGLMWGGNNVREELKIQAGGSRWENVDMAWERSSRYGWSIWTYLWLPEKPGEYIVRLRPKNPATKSPRLEEDYYARICRIDEV